MVSALVESKQVLEGMRAAGRLANLFLVVAGDGPLRADVDRLASQILPGRFLRGTFPHERMPDLYRCADVFLHPASFESFGNVYVEALATGLPVVANDNSLTRWILGDNGYLVDGTSEENLAAALRAALDDPHAHAADRTAFAQSKYSWKSIAALYRSFLVEVAQK
jgi:glycosyltransferase involved in cell wall biosynthesis